MLWACAGFRGGWESVPYVGEVPPAFPEVETAYEAQRRMELTFPGLTLGVGLGNRLRTYDTQVYLFVLPLSVDPRRVPTPGVAPDTTRVSLRVTPEVAGYQFDPQRARLTVDGRTVVGRTGFEFGMWDAAGQRVAAGGKWDHRPVGDAMALDEPGRKVSVSRSVANCWPRVAMSSFTIGAAQLPRRRWRPRPSRTAGAMPAPRPI